MLGEPRNPIRSACSAVATSSLRSVRPGLREMSSLNRRSTVVQFGQPSKYCRVISMPATLDLVPDFKVSA